MPQVQLRHNSNMIIGIINTSTYCIALPSSTGEQHWRRLRSADISHVRRLLCIIFALHSKSTTQLTRPMHKSGGKTDCARRSKTARLPSAVQLLFHDASMRLYWIQWPVTSTSPNPHTKSSAAWLNEYSAPLMTTACCWQRNQKTPSSLKKQASTRQRVHDAVLASTWAGHFLRVSAFTYSNH